MHPSSKVVVAEGECMLNRQRRVKPLIRQAVSEGRRVTRARFYIDPETCTGDHGCIRLSGCPSLTIRDNPDPCARIPCPMSTTVVLVAVFVAPMRIPPCCAPLSQGWR